MPYGISLCQYWKDKASGEAEIYRKDAPNGASDWYVPIKMSKEEKNILKRQRVK